MQIGMIGLGRMGSNMVRRLEAAHHDCVVFDANEKARSALADAGATPAADLEALVRGLAKPRAVWMMLPAAIVDSELDRLAPLLEAGDIIIDGGNSYYRDDIRRAKALAAKGIGYLDVGTSGGVFGAKRGYCLMIGGDAKAVAHLEPVFAALAPGASDGDADSDAADTPEKRQARAGYLHCGPAGAGHFVKMVHNGIEYGLMAAYAEGLNILAHADIGNTTQEHDAETTPLRDPEFYRYTFDLASIAEVWRHGSVISSWLLDLTAQALAQSPTLDGYAGRVSDSGEGRWTVLAGIDEGVPAPVLSAALFERFASRGADDFANRVLSAMRHAFGGHLEKPERT